VNDNPAEMANVQTGADFSAERKLDSDPGGMMLVDQPGKRIKGHPKSANLMEILDSSHPKRNFKSGMKKK